jgi:hypothetical protein
VPIPAADNLRIITDRRESIGVHGRFYAAIAQLDNRDDTVYIFHVS